MRIQIQDEALNKLLQKMKDADLKAPLRDSAIYMKNSIQQNFDAQGRPEKWQPLSPKYAAWKQKKGYSPDILILTGALRRSINISATAREARVFTGMKYGPIHQVGGSQIPARPFMVVQDEDISNIEDIFQRYYEKLGE